MLLLPPFLQPLLAEEVWHRCLCSVLFCVPLCVFACVSLSVSLSVSLPTCRRVWRCIGVQRDSGHGMPCNMSCTMTRNMTNQPQQGRKQGIGEQRALVRVWARAEWARCSGVMQCRHVFLSETSCHVFWSETRARASQGALVLAVLLCACAGYLTSRVRAAWQDRGAVVKGGPVLGLMMRLLPLLSFAPRSAVSFCTCTVPFPPPPRAPSPTEPRPLPRPVSLWHFEASRRAARA